MAIASGHVLAAPLALSPDLLRSLATDLGALLALALLATLWLLVQRVWRRALPEHAAVDEARDVRWGRCGAGCGCASGACRREADSGDTTAARHARHTEPFDPTSPHTETRR